MSSETENLSHPARTAAESAARDSLERESLAFVRHLQSLYFEKRDMDAVLKSIGSETSWLGAGAHEFCSNQGEVAAALRRDLAECPGPFSIVSDSCRTLPLSPTTCAVFGCIKACSADPDIEDQNNRMTVICAKTDAGIRLLHLHLSRPDSSQEEGCYYVKRGAAAEQKNERETLRLTLERHQIIMDQATDVIFEWDIRKDTLVFSSNWKKKFGYEPIRQDISQLIPHSRNIHRDDMAAFLKIMNDTASGVPYSETEFRICDLLGSYSWCRIRATTQYDGSGQPIKAVGVILDIDADKKQNQRLLEQARRDSLTNLLDKQAARQSVEELLSRPDYTQGVLFIIDLDDFKQINDSYGHLCGDAVLTDVAGELRKIFRMSDVVARIGGDEFLAYLPGATLENAASRGKSIIDAIGSIRAVDHPARISCSVGAAAYPAAGRDFQTLYHCADLALYHVKSKGKNSFTLYDESLPVIESNRGAGQI